MTYPSPCEGCVLEAGCDVPCSAYLRWYDDKMEYARRMMNERAD